MKKKLQLKIFRKNIIQLLIFLGIVTFLSTHKNIFRIQDKKL